MKVKFVQLFLIFLVALFISRSDAAGTPKVVGGKMGSIRNMEYLVYLRRYGRFACGGSLVNPRFVVTAAHCVVDYPANALTVTGGTSFLTSGGVTRRVLRTFVNSGFTKSVKHNDVAVLKLRAPLQGANIATIPLCSHNMGPGAELLVAGWGVTVEGSKIPSRQLLTATVTLRSRQVCRRNYGKSAITNSMMCASSPGTDTCSGDSGGPVVHNGELCGIVSWGAGCARPGFPGIYTVINRVKPFIQNSLRQ